MLLPFVLGAATSLAHALGQTASVSAVSVPLLLPSGVAYDASGNLYVAETQAHRVRKIDTSGRITTVAGDGTQGFSGDGGAATAAQLDSPAALAFDGGGNLYICDSHNGRVREVSGTTGTITTVVGTGTPGFAGDGGIATKATLDLPVGLAADASGDLWIADARQHRIRRVDAATGLIRTVAGTGMQGFSGDGGLATAAMIDTPSGLAVDAAGDVFLADAHNHRVRRVDAASGVITTVAGDGGPGGFVAGPTAATTRLILPRGLALDAAGSVYVADAGAQRLLLLDATAGTITTVAGSGIEGFSGDASGPLSATMDAPRGTVVSPGGLLTFADSENGRVRQVTVAPVIETIAGLGGVASSGGPGLSEVNVALSGPNATTYGIGSLTAQVTTNGSASGTITLMEGGGVIATAALVENGASFNLAALPAGAHTVAASYSGDGGHAAAVSAPMLVTVSPAFVSATPNSASRAYGAATTGLTGAVSGLLAQDASRVAVSFGTTATQISPVGKYAITAALNGPAAGNYLLQATAAVLTVTKAGSVATIANVSVASGAAALLATVAVGSATTGQPTGTVTLLDGETPVAAGMVGASGTVALPSGSLASGPHVLTVYYSGDQNFLASTSAGTQVTLGGSSPAPSAGADFSLSVTGASTQTVVPGASASFGLWAQWTGAAMSSPVVLSVTGLPSYATAAFNPAYLPPGGAVSAVTLTVSMPTETAMLKSQDPGHVARVVATALCFCLPFVVRMRNGVRAPGRLVIVLCGVSAGLLFVTGCGDRVRTSAGVAGPTDKSYPLTITGTATDASGKTLQHSVAVTLVVQAAP